MWDKKLTETVTVLPARLPEGHGRSFKKGIADALLSEDQFSADLPNGHNLSYEKGKAAGIQLKQMIAKIVD